MKKGMLFILVLLTIISFTSYAFASYAPRLDGRPDAFDPDHSKGYFIWQDEKGLHIRTTTPGTEHVFSGTIRTDGTFEDVWGKSLGTDDIFHVNEDRDKITFKFTASGGADGIDLHVYDGSYVDFNLSLDGEDADPANIFIGKDGWHPGSYKFTLRHDENPEKYRDDRTVIIIGDPYWWHFHGYWGHGGYGHWHHW